MDDSARICALLLRNGVVPRRDLPELMVETTRRAVEERLQSVGFSLAETVFGDHYGLRLIDDVLAHVSFEPASNMGLKSDELALMAVLWVRLILQRRIEGQRQELSSAPTPVPPITLREETLIRDFGPLLGSRSQIRRNLTRLKNLKFIQVRGGLIDAGPLLPLAIDAGKMTEFIQSELLPLIDAEGEVGPGRSGTVDERILDSLRRHGNTASLQDLEADTHASREELKVSLKRLLQDGKVSVVGRGNDARVTLKGV